MKTATERFWLLIKPDKKEIYQVYTYAFFKGVIALSLPIGIQSIINLLQGGQVSTSWIVLVILVTLGIAMSGYMQLMQMRITETLQQKIFTRAAFDFTHRIPRIKFEAIYKHYAPELMNRFFDVLTLQKSLAKVVLEFSSASLQIFFGLILLSLYHPFFIIFSFLLVFIGYLIIRFTAVRGLKTSLEESKYKYKVVSWLEELARAKDSFKLAGITPLPAHKTDGHVMGYLTSRENHYQVLRTQYILLLLFKVLIALGLLVAGGLLVLDNQMNIGQFVAAELIILMVIDSAEKIILYLEHIFDVLTALEKLGQVSDLELDDHLKSSSLNHRIESAIDLVIKDVSFIYPGYTHPVINRFNFHFEAGKSYCITGQNGSGKSTLMHLISGLYQPAEGSININGFPLGNYNITKLYEVVGNGLVEETIFEGSLIDNITLGRENLPIDQVQWAIENTYLTEYVQSLPNGLDTIIEIAGHKLSKSVIQRIILARSIVNKPKLLLIENHIDFIEESIRKKILDFMTDSERGWTLICISNDEYLVKKTSKVIHMSNGNILHL